MVGLLGQRKIVGCHTRQSCRNQCTHQSAAIVARGILHPLGRAPQLRTILSDHPVIKLHGHRGSKHKVLRIPTIDGYIQNSIGTKQLRQRLWGLVVNLLPFVQPLLLQHKFRGVDGEYVEPLFGQWQGQR